MDWTSLVCPVNNIQIIRACKYTITYIEPAKNGEWRFHAATEQTFAHKGSRFHYFSRLRVKTASDPTPEPVAACIWLSLASVGHLSIIFGPDDIVIQFYSLQSSDNLFPEAPPPPGLQMTDPQCHLRGTEWQCVSVHSVQNGSAIHTAEWLEW